MKTKTMEIVLNTFGTALSCENDGLVVKTDRGKKRLPQYGVSSILIGPGVSVTSNAVLHAIEREIELHFVTRGGDMKGLVWSHKYGSISTIRKGQLAFAQSVDAVEWIVGVITRKLENQQALLLMLDSVDDRGRRVVESSIKRIGGYLEKLKSVFGATVRDVASELRGIEGNAARHYFTALSASLPVRYRFDERSQHPARDPANALLNYGYGILYGKVEAALIKAGIDPYVGVLHRDEYNRPVLAYDVIEQYRVWVDYVVVQLLMQSAVDDCYYSVDEAGACWLEPLGRRVMIQSLNDYMDEVVTQRDGERRNRVNHIQQEAYELARRLRAAK